MRGDRTTGRARSPSLITFTNGGIQLISAEFAAGSDDTPAAARPSVVPPLSGRFTDTCGNSCRSADIAPLAAEQQVLNQMIVAAAEHGEV